MVDVPDGDLLVDVLVIGGGIMGHYLTRSLANRYSVCMLTDPTVRVETIEAEGYFSAGYDGNDVARIQPARRAAGYWKLWAESNGVEHDQADKQFLLAPDDEVARTRLWSDASLVFRRADAIAPVFSGGSCADHVPYLVENDVVVNPAHVLAELRRGIEDCCVEGEVVRFGLATDEAIDHVEVDVDGQTVPIVPRFVVLAASGGNAGLLHKIAVRFRDPARRKAGIDTARASQAVRHRLLVCVKGAELPLVAGQVDGLHVAAHPLTDTIDRVWLVSPPIDDARTVLGEEDLRFEVPVDSDAVADTVDRLLAASPELAGIAHRLQWSAYGRRKTEHPMMAVPDTSAVGQPAPAKVETFGLDAFLALWPSHLSYAMIVGDVAAERIGEALGPTGAFSDGLLPRHLAGRSEPFRARWDHPEFPWDNWETFAGVHGIKFD